MAQFNQGVYVCEITNQGFDESKEKKTPYFWLEVRPLGQVNPEDPEGQLWGCEDFLRSVSLWLTEKCVERSRDRLMGLGWDGNRWQDLEPGGPCSFAGKELRLQCTHEQNGDKVYEKWDFPFDGPKEMTHKAGLARGIDALFGRNKKPPAQPPTTQRAAPRNTTAAPAASENYAKEDIPF